MLYQFKEEKVCVIEILVSIMVIMLKSSYFIYIFYSLKRNQGPIQKKVKDSKDTNREKCENQ